MDEYYCFPEDDDGAAAAHQLELEAQQLEADRAAQLADRANWERFSRYFDRVLDVTVGRAVPF